MLVRGGRVRVIFRPDVVPRMSALEGVLDGEEVVTIEVRRIAPLSLILECADEERLAGVVVRTFWTCWADTSGEGRGYND